MNPIKYLIPCILLTLVACARLNEEDDTAELAAAELNKVGLYQSNLTPAPGDPSALPSPYLILGENLLTNGSFESPLLSEPWSALLNDVVPGWHGSWVDATCTQPVRIELQSKELFSLTPDLNQYAELDSNGACSDDARLTLTQSFYTTVNHIYRISFWMRARDAEHAMGLRLGVGGPYTFDLTPAADGWQLVTLHFEATAAATTIAFTETGAGDTYGTFIDKVEVREISVDVAKLPKPAKKSPGKGKKSFEGGRRHKDCNRGH